MLAADTIRPASGMDGSQRSVGHLAENLNATAITLPEDIATAIDERFGAGSTLGTPFHDPSRDTGIHTHQEPEK
jgi:hypothetical protein